MAQDNMNKYGLLGKNANQMTLLLNKIERRLGLSVIPTPEGLHKEDWANIIMEDTIPEFSRYFPYCITTLVRPTPNKDGWCFIDQDLPEGTRILGVRDIDWMAYRSDPRVDRFGMQMYSLDWISREFGVDDSMLTITGNDLMSFFSAGMGIYIEWEYPNKIKLVSTNGFQVSKNRPFPLKILIEHPGLWTISPTMMTKFEELATADVAVAVWQVLKYYDNMDTSYATLSLQLDTLNDWNNRRPEIVRELQEASVSASNEYQPVLICM